MSLIVVEAGKTELGYWADVWRYRELFFFLSWRDIIVRYKQTVIGVLWAVIRPIMTMIVFTVLFSRLGNIPSDGLPFAVMVYAAMLPWQFFSSSMSDASNSLIANANMLSKIYFPRLIVPASSVIVSFADFLISAVIMIFLMAWFRVVPDWQFLFLPFFILLGFFASIGIGLWLSALNVKYRDFRYVIPFIVQFGTYISPVGFPSGLVRQKFGRLAYDVFCLNPMVGVINGFRWCLGGRFHVPLDGYSVLVSAAIVTIVITFGLRYFRSTEETFADII